MSSFINSTTKLWLFGFKNKIFNKHLKFEKKSNKFLAACTHFFSTEATTPTQENHPTIQKDKNSSSEKKKNLSTKISIFGKTDDSKVSPAQLDAASSENVSFAKMLKSSALVQMGDPEDALVKGVIVEIMDDNLFIDFGGKFLAVCRKPRFKSE